VDRLNLLFAVLGSGKMSRRNDAFCTSRLLTYFGFLYFSHQISRRNLLLRI